MLVFFVVDCYLWCCVFVFECSYVFWIWLFFIAVVDILFVGLFIWVWLCLGYLRLTVIWCLLCWFRLVGGLPVWCDVFVLLLLVVGCLVMLVLVAFVCCFGLMVCVFGFC